MKKTFLFLALLFSLASYAQNTTFQQGWYIVQPGAQYQQVDPMAAGGEMIPSDDTADISLIRAGETVLVFDQSGDKYFCYDAFGRLLVFKGKKSLLKGKITGNNGIGWIASGITLVNGTEIHQNGMYWLVGQNLAKNTVTLQLEEGKTVEIPQDNVTLFTPLLKQMSTAERFYTAN